MLASIGDPWRKSKKLSNASPSFLYPAPQGRGDMYYGDVDGQDFKLCQLLENLQVIEHFADQPIDGKFCKYIGSLGWYIQI